MSAGKYEFKSEFALKHRSEGRAEGRAEGLAQALLTVLRQRGIAGTDEQRARIIGCDDEEMLKRWLDRSFAVASLDELFDV